jgi:hypothetical protein
MVRAGTHLAAGAMAAALLLAGAGGALAFADTGGESAGGESASGSSSGSNGAEDSGPASAAHSADAGAASGPERPTSTVGDQAERAVEPPATEAADSAPEKPAEQPTEKKPPVEHVHGSDKCPCKTVNKTPVVSEAPPPMELAPVPQAPVVAPAIEAPVPADLPPAIEAPVPADLPPAIEAPVPADLPPAIPAAPVDPNTVDSMVGEGGHRSGGNEPPVLTVPVLLAPAPVPQVQLGASIVPRGTAGGRTVESQSAGEAAPELLRASADGRLLNESSFASLGVTSPGQIPYRTGYSDYSSRSLAMTAAGALPGLAGLVLITAAGVCLGYRQANMAQQLRPEGAARFLI